MLTIKTEFCETSKNQTRDKMMQTKVGIQNTTGIRMELNSKYKLKNKHIRKRERENTRTQLSVILTASKD